MQTLTDIVGILHRALESKGMTAEEIAKIVEKGE